MWLSMSGRVSLSGPGVPKIVFYLIMHVFSHACRTCLVLLWPACLKIIFSSARFGSTFSLFFCFHQTTFYLLFLWIYQHFSFKDGIFFYSSFFFLCNFKRFWLEEKVDLCVQSNMIQSHSPSINKIDLSLLIIVNINWTLCAKEHAKCFQYIISFNPYINTIKWMLFLFVYILKEKWSLKPLRNLPGSHS